MSKFINDTLRGIVAAIIVVGCAIIIGKCTGDALATDYYITQNGSGGDGEGIALDYFGSAPDIGAWEYEMGTDPPPAPIGFRVSNED